MPSKLTLTALAAALALTGTFAACSDSGDDNSASDTATSLADKVEEGAKDAATTVADAANDATDAAAEAAARTLAAQQGAEQFKDAGAEIDGELTCQANTRESDPGKIELACSGTTVDGKQAGMLGLTSELPGASATELKGQFTGSVDGDEVFTTDTLGGS